MRLFGTEDDGQTVEIHRGETITIGLPETASTGFRWTVQQVDATLELVATEGAYPAAGAGAGGTASFSMRGKEAGSGTVVLKLWRPWEGDASVARRFTLRLTVLP